MEKQMMTPEYYTSTRGEAINMLANNLLDQIVQFTAIFWNAEIFMPIAYPFDGNVSPDVIEELIDRCEKAGWDAQLANLGKVLILQPSTKLKIVGNVE
jgi:hypothetical protein